MLWRLSFDWWRFFSGQEENMKARNRSRNRQIMSSFLANLSSAYSSRLLLTCDKGILAWEKTSALSSYCCRIVSHQSLEYRTYLPWGERLGCWTTKSVINIYDHIEPLQTWCGVADGSPVMLKILRYRWEIRLFNRKQREERKRPYQASAERVWGGWQVNILCKSEYYFVVIAML